MKSLPSNSLRSLGSIEPLEARIAPAKMIFIGNPDFQNTLDTEYLESDPTRAFFVNTSLASLDPAAEPEGNPFEAAADDISQAVDGDGVGTYYMQLKEGDTVFRFTEGGGYRELLKVQQGTVVAFFTDYDHDFEYDDGEFTGLALGAKAKIRVAEKLFGDAVTNLDASKKGNITPDPTDDRLDMTGLVSSKQKIDLLAIQGGSLFGKVLSGGTIKKLTVSGNVDGVYAGSAAVGQTYDFFPGVDGGEGEVKGADVAGGLVYPKGQKGAAIKNVIVGSVTNDIQAGDGGLGGAGGSIKNIQVSGDSDGLRLIAGDGGDGNGSSKAPKGGAGGLVESVYISGLTDLTPSGPFDHRVEVLAGEGGAGTAAVAGGAGGSAKKIFVGFDLTPTGGVPSGELFGDDVLVQAGAGGEGSLGGKGGKVAGSVIRVQTPDDTGDEIAVIAGAGGNSLAEKGGVAGKGGGVKNLDAQNRILTFDSDLLVQAGDAGTAVGKGLGARGGDLSNVKLLGFDVRALAGDGSDGKTGGNGGSLLDVSLITDENQLILTHNAVLDAGKGGNGTKGVGGSGGLVQSLRVENSDIQSLLINSGSSGNGGNSLKNLGGAGGQVSGLFISDTDSGNGFEGLINVRSGDGGDGGKGGGVGAVLLKTNITALNSNVLATAGQGGNATIKGDGGLGGALKKVRLTADGEVNELFVAGTASAGAGGDGFGKRGDGGVGGGVRFVNLNMDGDTTLTAGKGGDGQNNFLNSTGGTVVGGAPGHGGNVQVSGLFATNGSGTLLAGDAGDNGVGPANGGNISGGLEAELIGLRATLSLLAKAGNGSHGGSGGSITNLAYGSTSDSLTPTPVGNILIQAGNGSSEGQFAGAGGSLKAIDGSVSSGLNSSTSLLAGDGGGIVNAALPVLEEVEGAAAVNEVQVVNLSSLVGVDKAKFRLNFGAEKTTDLLNAETLNLAAIQAEINRVLGAGMATASLDAADSSQLRITFSTAGDQAAIEATGGNGTLASKGGSISKVTIFLGGGEGVELKFEAGDGGDGAKTGGNGGNILNVGVAGIDAATIVRSFGAGDGGDAADLGGTGGDVTSVKVEDHDIGVRSGLNFGYTTMGGIFAGSGGEATKDGKAGSVRDISANSIASIVAGKTLIPELATKVSEIILNDGVQLVRRDGAMVTNSPFTLTFNGETTSPLPGNATRSEVEAKLNNLPAIQATGPNNSGSVSVVFGPAGSYIVSFNSTGNQTLLIGEEAVPVDVFTTVEGEIVTFPLAETISGAVILDVTSTAPGQTVLPVFESVAGSLFFTTSELIQGDDQAAPPIVEVQRLDITGLLPFATGEFVLSFNGQTTPALPSTATATQIQTALNALGTVTAVGGVTVGTFTAGRFNIQFVQPGNQAPITGLLSRPETQQIALGAFTTVPNAEFTLSYADANGVVSTTPSLAANASIATIDAALEALPTIQALNGATGNKVSVTEPQPGTYAITFNSVGEKNALNAVGISPETQRVDLGELVNSPGSVYQLRFGGVLTQPIAVGADAATIDAAVENLSTIQALNGDAGNQVTVVKTSANLFSVSFTGNGDKAEFEGVGLRPELQTLDLRPLAGTLGAEFTLTIAHNLAVTETTQGNALPITVTTLRPGEIALPVAETTPGTATVLESQTISLGSVAGQPGATFRLTFGTSSTGLFPFNETAANIQTALNALPDITAVSGVTVTGNPGGPYTVTFTQPGDQALFSGVGFGSEIQGVDLGALSGAPGGEFTLRVLDYSTNPPTVIATTSAIPANATPLVVDMALEKMLATVPINGPVDNKVTVAIGTAGNEYAITFTGTGDKALLGGAGGGTAQREVQTIDLRPLAAFQPNTEFTLQFGGDITPLLAGTSTFTEVDTALEALPSIQALLGPVGNKVVVTSPELNVFQVNFSSFGNQAILLGQSQVGLTPATIGTTGRLPNDATAAEIEAAIEAVSQVGVSVIDGTTDGTFSITFEENADQPAIISTAYLYENQIIDPYSVGEFVLQFGFNPATTARLPAMTSAAELDAALEALPEVITLGAGGDNLQVIAGPNSSYTVLFNVDGDVPSFAGTQYEAFSVSNEINGFNRDGSANVREQQILRYFDKREFEPLFYSQANIVGAIADINEVDSNVFHYVESNGTTGFQLGEQPIDGLIMAKKIDQTTLSFTAEAYLTNEGFFDNDNII